ncbi:unnamed protein product [Hymenolepis diminuta]|uniref:Uncharacterized protein n=1 Tax=Hymenolepis diminuta TaxID=6216 RepID=A0A564YMF5_HYMDI|nr:unnamed protein product [Hymenolepis diminuta]
MIDPPITQEEWDAAEHESDRGPVLNFLQSAMDRVKKIVPPRKKKNKKVKCEDCENEIKGCALLTVCLVN